MKETKTINLFNLTGINGTVFLVLAFCLSLAFCGEPDLVDGLVSNLQCKGAE